MKRVWILLLLLLVIVLAIQFIRPSLGNPPVTGDLKAPPEVKAVLQRACYDCHSNQTQLRWFDEVAPAYWRVAQDVKDGRKALNFSNWDSLSQIQQLANLFEAVFMIEQKAMPLPAYTNFHHSGIVTADEIRTLKKYVATLGYHPVLDTARARKTWQQYEQWRPGAERVDVKDAPNGIAYGPLSGYSGWQVVSTNERFDYGIMHVILGNPIAVKAIREGHTNPYPDGTIFAKPAWLQTPDSSGEILSGAFLQTEFKSRDSRKYAATFGWGWCRWVGGTALLPYGKNASFPTECMNCHRPLEKTDHTFTIPYVDSLRVGAVAAETAVAASLPDDSLAFPLRGRLVTFFVDPIKGTMSTLYSSSPVTSNTYSVGTVLSLVTWTRQDDEYWFGGRIPQTVVSVEQVRFGADGKPEYTAYAGAALSKKNVASDTAAQRVQYMVAKRAAVIP